MHVALLCLDPGVPFAGSRKGASVHLQSVAAALLRTGHSVTALCAEPGDVGRVAGLVERGLVVQPLPKSAGAGALARHLERLRPNLVLERLSLTGPDGAIAARDAGAMHVYEVNAPLDEEAARHRGLADAEGARERLVGGFAASRAAVAVSDEVAAWVRAIAPEHYPVAVEPNGAGPEFFAPPDGEVVARLREILRLRPDEFTIGFVGAFRPWHDLTALVAALSRVSRSLPARLLLVGDGPSRNDVLRQATAQGVSVTMAGNVAHEDVPAHLALMDAVAVPYASTADYFSPLKLFEAMAAGRAIVASATLPVSRVVVNRRQALLAPPGEAEAFAAALLELARAPELRRRLGREARRVAASRHTWDAVTARVVGFARHHALRAELPCEP